MLDCKKIDTTTIIIIILSVYNKLCQLFLYSVFNTCQKVNTAVYAENFLDRLQTIKIKTYNLEQTNLVCHRIGTHKSEAHHRYGGSCVYIRNRSWELVLYRHPTIFTKVQI